MTQLQGPGPLPEASRSRSSPSRCCATARCSCSSGTSTVPAVPRCTTRPAGTGPRPVRWIRVQESDTFTVLQDGRVLLAGRRAPRCTTRTAGPGPPQVRLGIRFYDTFTVLRDGRVLVAAGDHAQVYDPASGTWTATGKKNGQGYGGSGRPAVRRQGPRCRRHVFDGDYHDLDSAEVYDPVTGSWTTIASMHAKANPRAAYLQPDGKVLVVGSRR